MLSYRQKLLTREETKLKGNKIKITNKMIWSIQPVKAQQPESVQQTTIPFLASPFQGDFKY